MTTNKSFNNLKVAITNRQIITIALPISFAIFVPQINFITNTIFLGRLGEGALAAAGITGVAYLIFSVIGVGMNNGLQALISRRAGEERVDEIGILFSQGVYIALAVAFAGIIFIYLPAPHILHFALQSDAVREKTISFMRIRIWGLPFLYIYQMRNALLIGTNQSRYLISGAVAETVCNIFFDYGLIYGHFGMPALGFNGAAYASIIAEFTGMIVVFGVIHLKGISKRFNLFTHFNWNPKVMKLIISQSYPLVFQFGMSITTWQFFYILIEHHGERALAISSTMRNIFGLFGVVTWAFGATTNTMVSNVIGQGMKDQVPLLIRKIAFISTGAGLFFCMVLNVFPGAILSVFGQGPDFTAEAVPVIRVVSSALVIASFAMVWLNAVTGTGNSRVNFNIELVTIIAYSIYVYVILEVLRLPIVYGWMSEWIYWIMLFVLSRMYIRSGRWEAKVI